MAVQTQRTPDGTFVARQTGDLTAKLFGLPFLAIGLWFLYQMVMALFETLRHPTVADVLGLVPGLLVLTLMMLAFGGPGILLVLAKLLVTVDPMTHEVAAVRDFGLFKKEERHARDELSAVAVTHRRVSSSNARKQHWAYHVDFETKRGAEPRVLVGLTDTLEEARGLATEVAAAAGLPMIDRTEEGDVEEQQEAAAEDE